jgi:probable phosphoglycerate mutase
MRHGSIEGHQTRRFVGQADIPLDAAGRSMAAWWAERLPIDEISQVWSSDLGRTREMASIIAGARLEVNEDSGLREIGLGEWEGVEVAVMRERDPELFAARGADMAGFRTPGGETFYEVQERFCAALGRIRSGSRGDVLVVAHGGANRTLLCRLLGMPLENLFRIGQDYGCLNVIDADDVVKGINLTPEAVDGLSPLRLNTT